MSIVATTINVDTIGYNGLTIQYTTKQANIHNFDLLPTLCLYNLKVRIISFLCVERCGKVYKEFQRVKEIQTPMSTHLSGGINRTQFIF